MPKLLQPSEAASKAARKAHRAMAKATLRATESLIHDLRGMGTRAEGMLLLSIRIFDKRSGEQVGGNLKGVTITVLGDSESTKSS